MADVYVRMQATALRLIAKYGRIVPFSRNVDGEYDPGTGGVGETTEPEDATVVVLPASGGTVQAFDIKFDNGTLIETNIRALIIAAKDLAWMPVPGDKATFDGETWTFIGCTPVNPAGTPIVYKASVRR
ncbi:MULTISPECIES: hypothetical protein [Pseudomonas]|uniref:hypothetical protein n=1 Tax=Pseudomonas TaxID=286 RepID=UPI003002AC2C